MTKKIIFLLIISIIAAASASAEEKKIQVFDPALKRVVIDIPMKEETQTQTEAVLKSINGVYKNLHPLPKNGYMAKIPLAPSVMVKNQWVEALVDEVIIIFPKGASPYLLLFDDENNTHFLTFSGSAEQIKKRIQKGR